MTVSRIPLKQRPSQAVNVNLDGQPCTIVLRLLGGRQYLSLSKSGVVICDNVLIQDRSKIVRAAYTGFTGELISIDLQGDEPPAYTGWGDRWVLVFNSAG